MTQAPPHRRIEPVAVGSAPARELLRAYYADIVDRYHRVHHHRPATGSEIGQAMADGPSGHLAPPDGVFLVATHDGVPVGCAGIHLPDPAAGTGGGPGPRTAELTRVYVTAGARRCGLGGALLAAAERSAVTVLGATRIRLDTRADLVEARALYARHGYREIPAYHHRPYGDHFFEKTLDRPAPSGT